jgi:Na+:H+ antiporter
LVPIFFTSLSFHLHLSWNLNFLLFSLILISVATLGKLLSCGLGARLFHFNLWESSIIGVGMKGRGAVELVVATVVLNLSHELMERQVIQEPLLNPNQFSALVLMAFVTTLITPLLLKWVITRSCRPSEKADFCRLWDQRGYS